MEAQASQKIEKMSMTEFLEAQQEYPFELINGEKVRIMPNFFGPDFYIGVLFELLKHFVQHNQSGKITSKLTFVLTFDKTYWVTGSREPDLMYFTRERWLAYVAANPDLMSRPIVMVPDLTVEVMSANDSLQSAQDKAELYLADGVRLVWLIDPLRRAIYIYTQGEEPRQLRKSEPLTGGDVIPGFMLNPTEFFNSNPADL